MVSVNCLNTDILQNIFLHTGLKQLEGEYMITIFILKRTIPLSCNSLFSYDVKKYEMQMEGMK